MLRRGRGGERPRRNLIELNRGRQARRLWGSMAGRQAWCGLGGAAEDAASVALDGRGRVLSLVRHRFWRWAIVAACCGHRSTMQCRDRLCGDYAAGSAHEVSRLGGRRRPGPGRNSMIVMGPPQQGHGNDLSPTSAADVSSPLSTAAGAIATASDLRMAASFTLRWPLARKP